MVLKTLKEAKGLKGKKVLLRVAYDVPLKPQGKGWAVADDRRIAETLPTIKYLLRQDCRIVLLSWLGRPDGKVVEKYKMDPVAKALAKLLGQPVQKLDDCIGPKVFKEIQQLKPGQILLLENTRFYRQEEENDRHFARLLVHGLDLIVFDAFAQAHRVHASTTGILKLLPSYAGFLLEKEIKELSRITRQPKKPLVIILGGAKISDKIAILRHLVKRADYFLIGGGVANVFLKAKKVPIGHSFIQDSFVDGARHKKIKAAKVAKQLYRHHSQKFILPRDLLSANEIAAQALVEMIDLEKKEIINQRWKFVDVGPKTIKEFSAIIKKAKTIFWNGPMGVFEIDKFSLATKKIAQAVAHSRAVSVIGGGDTETVVAKYKLAGKFTHVSTGGGASLEFLAGKELPVLPFLKKK